MSKLLTMLMKNETPTPVITFKGLCFIAQDDSVTISLSIKGSPIYNIKYSFDTKSWQTLADSSTSTINSVTINNGQSIYFKGTYSGQALTQYISFVMTGNGKIIASGNTYSILDEDNFENITDLTNYTNNTLRHLFYNCTLLIQAPELPATVLTQNCYVNMFYGCTSLIKAPYLPATTLANYCYQVMFKGCSSLNEIKIAYTDLFNTSFASPTFLWVEDISSTGTFYYNGSDTTRGVSAIPENWTITPFS